ncbi:M28 family peptidase [Pontimicrobium sp. IMCC45349]|uniref:M28 family peptidase n=1 Tax=Pontimicrobium sp. IMCC45349 TaxID=3391574 RepID=UPI0039A11D82
MKKHLLLFASLLAIFSCKKEAQTEDIIGYAETISADELKEMLYVYASDEFEGRETGQPGQKKAVDYLKNQYESLQVPSAITEGDYFQEVPLQIIKTPKVEMTIGEQSFNYFEDFITLTSPETSNFDASEIVYVGYGIDHEKHNDYKDLDVKDKIVVVIAGEPKDNAGNYIISGSKEISKWSNGRQSLRSKREAAEKNGAKAMFLLDDNLFKRYAAYYKKVEEKGGSNRLSLLAKEKTIYGFLISEKLGNALIENISDKKDNGVVAKNIDVKYESVTVPMSSENVVSIIKGSEKPDEYVIISAHLDHNGIHDGEVFNGADDDGSGTVAMLEIAEAFKEAEKNGHGPKRSIVFLHVTGEEKGLLGSKYYTDYNPIVPLENTVANLNIDMIGRVDPKRKDGDRNYVYLIGSDKLSTELHNLSEEVNQKYTNIELDYTYNDEDDPNRYYYRSDHYNFAKNNIPVIFYFNGTHDDYHKATDTADKIEYDLLENRTRLVFHTAWEVANREKAPEVDKAPAKP